MATTAIASKRLIQATSAIPALGTIPLTFVHFALAHAAI
jgi:hypothetical protein